MSGSQEARDLFLALRRLAAEHPREARGRIGQLLDERPPELKPLLAQIGAPGEGRLRHIIANSIRAKVERASAVPDLAQWLASETDEFTKHSLRLAVKESGASEPVPNKTSTARPADDHFVEAYRHASSRLSHRVRNALMEPQTALMKLRRLMSELREPLLYTSLLKTVEELNAGFQRVSRVVEFNTEDRYFEMRQVVLRDWLLSMNVEYGKQFAPIQLEVDVDADSASSLVYANDHLLNAVFWNLWINAQQAVEDSCRISIRIMKEKAHVCVTVSDNGEGFSVGARDAVFVQSYSGYSASGVNRGSGLLEVQDAVGRLHGEVGLVQEGSHYRVRIRFPKVER